MYMKKGRNKTNEKKWKMNTFTFLSFLPSPTLYYSLPFLIYQVKWGGNQEDRVDKGERMIKEDKKWNKKHENKMKDGEKRVKKGKKKMEKFPERKQGCVDVGKRKEDKGNTIREGKGTW